MATAASDSGLVQCNPFPSIGGGLWSVRSELLVHNETEPDGYEKPEENVILDIRAGGDNDVGRGQLEA